MEILDEIVSEFLVESYESLDQLDRDLMALEETPDDRDRIASIFRTIHTIKGTSGFLAFPLLEGVAHVGENLLVALRDGELTLTSDIANALLAMVDAVRSILANIEAGNGEGEDCYGDLKETLEQLRSGEAVPAPSAEIEVEAVVKELQPAKAAAKPAAKATAEVGGRKNSALTKNSGKASSKEEPEDEIVEDVCDSSDADEALAGNVDSMEAEVESRAVGKTSRAKANSKPSGNSGNGQGGSIAESSVRIDVHLLDKLMNLVGELVLARNQIMQFSQHSEDPALTAASQRVNLITTELQEGVMKTRMQPIRNAWAKLPRVVRDLSHSCGKQVQVKMEGADTELDKTILEAIKDPLTHIVRNSVDHGIESPKDRVAAGKPAEGTLLLRAYHEGGQVNIEIVDDGGGINIDRVRAKAVDKGLVTEEQAAAMTDREAVQLILLPGFSTAPKVTNVSGRGVGMDVVKTNVEKIGGTLDIQSIVGRGTTLRIKIPLTLAIVPALIITCDSDRYCIPQVSLLELVRLDGDRVRNEIEILHSVPVYRLRGRLLPLVYLDEELGLRPRRTPTELTEDETVNIVVLQAEDRQFGLVVHEINDTQEIVVKPLGHHLKGIRVYAGSTIMGDGTVSLILDVIGIAQQGSILSEQTGRQFLDAQEARTDSKQDRSSYLIVDPSDDTRAAIPLSTVARLEEVRVAEIERVRHQSVIQYRDQIMPLVSLAEYGDIDTSSETISLVVYNHNGRNIGVVVGRIIDIIDHAALPANQKDDTQIIAGRVTRIVDLSQIAAGVA